MRNDIYSEDFENFIKKLDILYVEDEDRVRALLEKRLKREFGVIYTAQNGEIGLYKFETHRPRLVITDIRMPVMDGLEMISHIKAKSPNTKIIITTAHSDSSFMMRSIEIGIDKYILKPINLEEFIYAIKKLCFSIYNEKIAGEYQLNNLAEQTNKSVKNIFETTLLDMPNPAALYVDKKPIFINKAFIQLFDAQTIGKISGGKIDIEELLRGGDSRKTEITLPSGRKKLFFVYKTPIEIAEQKSGVLYTLNNFTMLEYQNVKLKNYADILYDILKVKTSQEQAREGAKELKPDVKERVQKETPQKLNIKEEPQELSNIISNDEMRALKQSRALKISAAEYVEELNQDILEELDELKEVEGEISYILDSIEDGDFEATAIKLGARFLSYSRSVARLLEFHDLAIAVKNLGVFLSNLKDEDYGKWSRILMYAQNIKMDLANWRNKIFVEKKALDIHYLDSSLMSSCIQIQLFATGQESLMDDENDLELF